MSTTARSFLASHRDAAKVVEGAEKFFVRLPVLGRVAIPPPDQLAFYGVVGGLAALGLIDWPVALAIGVGQAVTARHFSDQRPADQRPADQRPADQRPAAAEPDSPAAPVRKTAASQKSTPRKTAAQKSTPRKTAAQRRS